MKRVGPWVAACFVVLIARGWMARAQSEGAGDPLPNLSPPDLAAFQEGRDEFFLDEFHPEHGLGPAFNGDSCGRCHNLPVVGGTGIVVETHAARAGGRALTETGDTLIHLFSVPPHECQPQIPPDAAVVAHRISIPLFGAGLIEAIPDDVIRGLEDSADRNNDGARGRAAVVFDLASLTRRVGRFGWKAQHATLVAFAADAFRNEMGVPNPLLANQYAFGFDAGQMARCNPVAGFVTRGFLESTAAFMRFLAPVARGAVDEATREGERIFSAVGCASCHVPSLTTGPNANPALNERPVPLFSDLLLHNIGTGDGIPQAAAGPDEIRTPALWGLRLRRPLLHDGSAATIEEAILRHGGEGEVARRGFVQATPSERSKLLSFLRSL